MFSNQAAELPLNVPTKALDAVRADKADSRFVVGSCALQQNHLSVLRFHSELNELGVDATLDHPTGPVGIISTSPADKSLVITAAEHKSSATLWRMPFDVVDRMDSLNYNPDGDDGTDGLMSSSGYSLEEVSILEHNGPSRLADIVWRDSAMLFDDDTSTAGEVLTVDFGGSLQLWDVGGGSARSVRSENIPLKFQITRPRVAWDPHNQHAVCVTDGTRVKVLDWRSDTSVPSGTVESFKAHRYGVTDIDYNPNKPYVLATGGQDGLVKFFDLRSAKSPLLVARGGHSHYVSNVKYNPFHDQLVVSTGTDSIVDLWRVSTISSAPLLTLDEENPEKSETSASNVRVARYEHADSVYGMTWSAADAWVYVTVGYDGKVALNHVPSKEKYKILL
jgi:WD40 repeat protein